jgi:hypothetical protein
MAESRSNVGPSVLFLLFGDQISRPQRGGLTVPCTDTRVSTDAVVLYAAHAALWALQEEGSVEIREVREKLLWLIPMRTRKYEVRSASGYRYGYERMLADPMQAGTHTISDAVRVLCGIWDRNDPGQFAVKKLIDEAVDAGFYERDESEPRCDRIAAVRSEFDAVHRRWAEFAATPLGVQVREDLDSSIRHQRQGT